MVYTTWSLFIFQPLHSLGECHCWWTRESLKAHAAKFNGRLQLIHSVSRLSTFSVLKFIEIVIFGVYLPSLLASVCFGFFVIYLFNFFSYMYFVWPRITDDGSVLEMRIWSILLSLFSYCKSHAFTLNTLWGFCKIYAQSRFFFVLAGGGGGWVNFDISSSLYFHFVIKFWLLLSICRLHFWCPLNLKMLPTPLYLLGTKGRVPGDVFLGEKNIYAQARIGHLAVTCAQVFGTCRYFSGDPESKFWETEVTSYKEKSWNKVPCVIS